MAASGVGSLLAALRLVFGGRPRPVRLATGALLLGVASLALAVTRVFPVALVLMVLIGFGSILMAATGNTTIQLAVPDHLRGRVMSVYTTVFSALGADRRAGDGRHRLGVRRDGRDRRSAAC